MPKQILELCHLPLSIPHPPSAGRAVLRAGPVCSGRRAAGRMSVSISLASLLRSLAWLPDVWCEENPAFQTTAPISFSVLDKEVLPCFSEGMPFPLSNTILPAAPECLMRGPKSLCPHTETASWDGFQLACQAALWRAWAQEAQGQSRWPRPRPHSSDAPGAPSLASLLGLIKPSRNKCQLYVSYL